MRIISTLVTSAGNSPDRISIPRLLSLWAGNPVCQSIKISRECDARAALTKRHYVHDATRSAPQSKSKECLTCPLHGEWLITAQTPEDL
jgi:hypothetical protein